jgi:hypothetical protein
MASQFTGAWQARDHVAASIGPLMPDDWATIARQTANRVNGVVASKKNDRCVPWRNSAERDLMHLLEVDTKVLSYEGMPERVNFIVDGVPRRHIPAVRVMTERGIVMIDVRRDQGPGASAWAEVSGLMREIYANQGIRYVALSHSEVRLRPRLDNAVYILGYRGRTVRAAERIQIKETLSRCGGTATIAELQTVMGEAANAVFPMVIHRMLQIDLSATDALQMRVSLLAGGTF